MNIGRAELHWVALRSLGTFARVVGETPQGEPIVAAGSDRLVLRRPEQRFWLAGRCERCGAEMAAVDLDEHQAACPGRASAPIESPVPRTETTRRTSRDAQARPVERRRAPHPGLGRHRKRALSEWGQVLVVLVLLACFLVLVAVLSSVGTPLTGR